MVDFKDTSFLRALDRVNLKTFYTKLTILDNREKPIREIQGKTQSGSISVSGSSAIKRSGSLVFLAEWENNDLHNIDNLLSMNKKVRIDVGIMNTIDRVHDPIIWFPQGIFVIHQPNLVHSTTGVTISLTLKDKMCLLNGELGGGLPTSVTFSSYDQVIGLQEVEGDYLPYEPNSYTVYKFKENYYRWSRYEGWTVNENYKDDEGSIEQIPQLIFDIIFTLVVNFGNEDISKVIVNDVPRELKQIVRYTGSDYIYYNPSTGQYSIDPDLVITDEWLSFGYNEDCGYVYTDFVYPNELVSAIGDNVCTILDKIVAELGNHHYFYDLEGRFIFQEKKNNLNWQYEPAFSVNREYTLKTRDGKEALILNEGNYAVDFSNTSQSIYDFAEDTSLIMNYSNNLNYSNIKNDFHVWGKNQDKLPIHYHLVIKEKPIPTVAGSGDQPPRYNTYWIEKDGDEGRIKLSDEKNGELYIPTDWRAELYMQGLEKKSREQRPDIYEQELLDLFDSIYNMAEKEFKIDIIHKPNELLYWIDYINPTVLYDISVDNIGPKVYSMQKDKIKKLYNTDIPDTIIIGDGFAAEIQQRIIKNCSDIGQQFSRVSDEIYQKISIGTWGYTAQETARDLLYQYTDYLSSISITTIPIYYLDTNNRITVRDRAADIYGDYVVNSISIPLDAQQTMTISASRALSRD